MLLHLSPRDWFFIFMALILSCYVKLASAKTHPGMKVQHLFDLAKVGRLL